MAWQRCLDEDAVHVGVGVEFAEPIEQVGLRRVHRQHGRLGANAELGRRALFHADVNPRRRIVTDANEREARLGAGRLERGNTGLGLRVNLPGNRAAVYQVIRRHQGSVLSVRTSSSGSAGQRGSTASMPVITTLRLRSIPISRSNVIGSPSSPLAVLSGPVSDE